MSPKKVEAVLAKIAKNKISRGDAATALEVSERTVNRLMRRNGVERPPSAAQLARAGARERAHARRARLLVLAQEVLADRMSVTQAAGAADASERTIWRWVFRAKTSKNQRKASKNRKNQKK